MSNIYITANGFTVTVTKIEKCTHDPLKPSVSNATGYVGYLDFNEHKLKHSYSGISGKYYDLIPKE